MNKSTRRYPWGIQRLVSTYSNHQWWGEGVLEKVGFGLREQNWSLDILGWGGSGKGRIWTQGTKLEFGNFEGGVLDKVGFGLREENWSLEILRGVFWTRLDLDSGKTIGIWKLGGGGSGKGQIWTQRRKLEFRYLGGCSEVVKSQSAKICLNFNFRGRGMFWSSQKSKCQDLSKFNFRGRGGANMHHRAINVLT